MTLAGIVARYHGVTSFETDYSRSGIASGAAAFTALVVLEINSLDDPDEELLIAGSANGSTGWGLFRPEGLDTEDFFFLRATIADAEFFIPVLRANAVGASLDIHFTSDGITASIFVNGVEHETISGVILAAGDDMRIASAGGESPQIEDLFTIVTVGYRDGASLAASIREEWQQIRRYNLDLAYELLWTGNSLSPADAEDVAAPSTWPNAGSAGAAGDLSRDSDESTLNFVTNPHAFFVPSIPMTIVRALRGFRRSRYSDEEVNLELGDAGGRITVDYSSPGLLNVTPQSVVPWLATDIVTIFVVNAPVTVTGVVASVPVADTGLTLTSLPGPCTFQIARNDAEDSWRVYGAMVPAP